MPPKKYSIRQAEEALLKNYGNVSAAAKALGVDHSTLFHALKKHERLQAARREAEEQTLDLAENSLVTAVKNCEAWAVCFLLKTKGRKRGYVERRELSGPDGDPFEVSILGPVMGGGEE